MMLRLVEGLKTDIEEVDGGSDGMLCFSDKESGKVWKYYNNGRVLGDAVGDPVVCVSREEVLQALNEMKTGNAPGPLDV